MNIGQGLKKMSKKLENNLEAEVLLSFILKKPKEFLFTHGEKKLSLIQSLKYKYLATKIQKGIPLAYLTSMKEFYGFSFQVNKNVLIPRPDTEMMVDEAFKAVDRNPDSRLNLIDVGTGSGCIIISLIKKLQGRVNKIKGLAIDIDRKTLRVAKKNARRYGLLKKIEFIKSNLLKEVFKKDRLFYGLTVILANLPYLTKKQIKDSPTIKNEPEKALLAGEEGLLYYQKLFEEIKENLNKFNGPLFIFLEIDHSQEEKIKELIKKELPEVGVEIKKDLRGFDRLVIATLKN